MGTHITLTVACHELAWAKNAMGDDYGPLFQHFDETRRKSDEVDYSYYDDPDDDRLVEHEAAFSRSLAGVLPRLNLMGHTLEAAREEYNSIKSFSEYIVSSSDPDQHTDYFEFDEFCRQVCRNPIASFENTDIGMWAALGQDVLERIPCVEPHDFPWAPFTMSCTLSPYALLQVLGTSKSNHDAEVTWHFGSLVANGWVDRRFFVAGARRNDKILIATEGTSDIHVLKQALALLRPDVEDFFRFIDLEGSHPFSGASNLVKFAEGAVAIDVQNKILFVLDNDAEGVSALRKLGSLSMPINMKAISLPNHDALTSFLAVGPEGAALSDINGRAAAIECYLDLNHPHFPPPQVRWSNYKKDIDAWQGALEYKDTYLDRFLKLRPSHHPFEGYDTSKITAVVEAIIDSASQLSRIQSVSADGL